MEPISAYPIYDEFPIMLQLIYVSSAKWLMSREDLLQILVKSRENNSRLGISGLLMYKDGSFMQMLEGEAEIVQTRFKRIGDDPRHSGIIILSRAEVEKRDFPDWSMGFRDLMSEEVQATPGYNEFLNVPLVDSQFMQSSRVAKLFRLFR